MKKVKIIGKDNVGWSVDKDNKNLNYFLSQLDEIKITNSFIDADVYFFVWYDLIFNIKYLPIRLLNSLLDIFGKKKKIVAWITNDVTQRNNFLNKKWPVDLWVSPNTKISKFLYNNKYLHTTIPFFVSPNIFKKLSDDRDLLAKKIGISDSLIKDKILIGSFQRDSEGVALDKPKWQKNPDLLIKICKHLPSTEYLLVLAGPRRHYLINRCKEEGIEYIFIGNEELIKNNIDDIYDNNINEEKINLLYNLIDFYVVTSKSEGGPKAILEASLAKTIICSTDVGLARDFLNPDLIYSESNTEVVGKIFNKFAESTYDNEIILGEYKNFNYSQALSVLNEDAYKSLIGKIFDAL